MEKFEITSRDVTVTLDMSKLSDELKEKAMYHGLKQKVSDAAAGAKKFAEENNMTIETATETLMSKVVTNLEKGDWGAERGTGSGLSAIMREVVSNLRKRVKAQNADWYKAAKESERVEACLAMFNGAPESTQAKLLDMAEQEIERKKALADDLGDLEF